MLLIISLATMLAFTALFLAWERGLDLADQVLAGNRITQSRLRHLQRARGHRLRGAIDRSERARALPQEPVVYLGQSSGQLMLFDLQRARRLRARTGTRASTSAPPTRVSLHIPSPA